MKSAKLLGSPSRNFCILGRTRINDPKDGREKLVLSNYASGKTGTIIIIDPETDEGEQITLPNDNGAWAILNMNDEYLLIGCCMTYGSIHTFDLRQRKFIATQNIPGENYIYSFVKASDGNAYCGTFPGCQLIKYDMKTHKAESLGCATTRSSNLYSRRLLSDVGGSGLIAVDCVMDGSEVAVYDIYKKEFIQHIDGSLGRVSPDILEVKGKNGPRYFDRRTFAELNEAPAEDTFERPEPKPFKNGNKYYADGQDYYVLYPDGKKEKRRIPVTPPSTAMMSFACDHSGKIWGASEFGLTICSLDLKTGEIRNFDTVTAGGGEVYGIVEKNGKIYMTSYVSGAHIVYDPTKPFNTDDNINPRTIKCLDKEGYARPHAKSIIGPDGNIWTGFWANYGIYGGAISVIDTRTDEVRFWESTVAKLSPNQVFTDGKLVYVSTTPDANGLQKSSELMHIYAIDTDFNVKYDVTVPEGYHIGPCIAFDDRIVASVYNVALNEHRFNTYSPKLELISSEVNDKWLHAALKLDGKRAVVCLESKLYYMNSELEVEEVCGLARPIYNIAMSPEGRLFVLDRADIYEIV